MTEEPKTLNEPFEAPQETISKGIVFWPSFQAPEENVVKPPAVDENKAVTPTAEKGIENSVPVIANEQEAEQPVNVKEEGEKVVKPATENKRAEAQKPNEDKQPTLPTCKPAAAKNVSRKNSKKKAKAKRAQNDPKSLPPTEKTMKVVEETSDLRIAIFAEGYPNILLDNNDVQLIQEDLLKKVEAQKHKAVKPGFLGTTSDSGYLVLECADKETAEWVKSQGGVLAPVKKHKLKITEEHQLLKKYTVKVSVPKCGNETIGKILNLLQAQNKGLFTSQWKVLQRTDTPRMIDLKFSVDSQSAETLGKDLTKLSYKWGQISFALEEESDVSLKRKKKQVQRSQKRAKKRNSERSQQKGFDALFNEQEKNAVLSRWFQYLDQGVNYLSNPLGGGPSHVGVNHNSNDNMSGKPQSQEFTSERFDMDAL